MSARCPGCETPGTVLWRRSSDESGEVVEFKCSRHWTCGWKITDFMPLSQHGAWHNLKSALDFQERMKKAGDGWKVLA